MALTLSLTSSDLNDETLQRLTSELCLDLGRNNIDAVLATMPATADDKAIDLPVWATITVAAIPTITALVNILKARVQLTKSLTIKLDGATGRPIEISASNLDEEKLNQLLAKYVKSEE